MDTMTRLDSAPALLTILALTAFYPLCAQAEATATRHVDLPKFSSTTPGSAFPGGWMQQMLPGVERENRFELISDEGSTVLRILSERSASSLAFALRLDPAKTPLLKWRWRVSNALAGSDLRVKTGDDYAARVYVLFDLPTERLSLGDRIKISAARLLHGADIPAAALCYVWGTRQATGESGWNPYTDWVRMIVVDSGNERAGQWREVERDVAADFKAAFGGPVPPVSGIALGADTDNTGERVETRFGDIHFEVQP